MGYKTKIHKSNIREKYLSKLLLDFLVRGENVHLCKFMEKLKISYASKIRFFCPCLFKHLKKRCFHAVWLIERCLFGNEKLFIYANSWKNNSYESEIKRFLSIAFKHLK